MLTREEVEKAIRYGDAVYDWSRNFKNKNVYELYLTIGNCGYRMATYSLKTKRIILTCPLIHIPSNVALENWIGYVEEKEKGDGETEN